MAKSIDMESYGALQNDDRDSENYLCVREPFLLHLECRRSSRRKRRKHRNSGAERPFQHSVSIRHQCRYIVFNANAWQRQGTTGHHLASHVGRCATCHGFVNVRVWHALAKRYLSGRMQVHSSTMEPYTWQSNISNNSTWHDSKCHLW